MGRMKRYSIFNYGSTWIGLARLGIAVYTVVWIFRIFFSNEPWWLKIMLILFCLVCIFGCIVEGWPCLKEGIRKSKEGSLDCLFLREPPPRQ